VGLAARLRLKLRRRAEMPFAPLEHDEESDRANGRGDRRRNEEAQSARRHDRRRIQAMPDARCEIGRDRRHGLVGHRAGEAAEGRKLLAAVLAAGEMAVDHPTLLEAELVV
jgi:hypothetical protein